jgi:hypothetical protein
VAYYFVALVLGLVNGLRPSPEWVAPGLSAVLVAVMYLVDHPRLGARTQRQVVTLDAAYPDRARLIHALEALLHADVRHVVVLELDLVRDTTVVDVRFRTRPPAMSTQMRASEAPTTVLAPVRLEREQVTA